MEWLKLIIPLIVAAVWIISHLAAGNQEKQQRRPPPRPLPPDDPNQEGRRPRRASAELEQFLEEVKRRKELEQIPEAILVADEPPRVPPPLPLPRPVEPRRDEPRRRSVPIGSKPAQRRLEPVVVVPPVPPPLPRPAAMPAPAPVQVVEPVRLTPVPPPPPPPPPAAPAGSRPEVISTKARSEAIILVHELLRKRRSLAGAFLLREIFDKPLSKRRRESR
jgi:hypothetical protein